MYFTVVLLCAVFASAQTCSSICVKGVCFDNLCACASGAYSDLTNTSLQCQLTAPTTCTYANLSNLVTDNYPHVDISASKVRNDTLHLVVYAPLVHNRLATRLYLSDINNASMYPACAFPGPNWVKTIDTTGNCREVYTADIAWTTVMLCGWTIDKTRPYKTVYRNNLFVRHEDELSTFRGLPVTRDTIHTFPIQITFQTVVDVQTTVTAVAPVNLLAAVTLQSFNPITRQGNVDVLTSLQWPFYLSSASIGTIPLEVSIALNQTTAACGNSTGDSCTQIYQIAINPTTACTLSGTYQLVFTIGCRGNASECALDNSTNTTQLVISVNSEDFCTGVQIDIGLKGLITVFQDSKFTTPRSSFLYGDRAYFRVMLLTNITVSIVSSTIEQVHVSNGTVAHFLYDQTLTADGTKSNFTVLSGQPASRPAFSFVINQQIMPVPLGSELNFTVFANILVSYSGGVQRRMVMAVRQSSTPSVSGEFGANVQLSNPVIPSPSPTPTVATPTPKPTPQPSSSRQTSSTISLPHTTPKISPTPTQPHHTIDHSDRLALSYLLLSFCI